MFPQVGLDGGKGISHPVSYGPLPSVIQEGQEVSIGIGEEGGKHLPEPCWGWTHLENAGASFQGQMQNFMDAAVWCGPQPPGEQRWIRYTPGSLQIQVC